MPRAPEYPFIPTDPEELVSELVSQHENIVGEVVRPYSKDRLRIEWMASVMIQERALGNHAANQNIPSRAEGKDLDALAELFYAQERPAPTYASCRIRFEISEAQEFDVLISKGTRVTDAGAALYWATVEELRIRAKETTVEGEAICQTAGTVGNGYAVGQICAIVDLFPYYKICANVTVSGGGSDAPDDDAFYELLRLSMDAYSCAGPTGGYIYHAKKVSAEIADVAVNSPAPAQVWLYVLMRDGQPAGEEVKAKVLAACSADEVRPFTDYVRVGDPETVPYSIDLTYYIPRDTSRSAAAVEAAVREAADAYTVWQSGKLGRDINPSKLYQLLMGAGIKRVELRAPVFTVLRDGRMAMDASFDDFAATVPQVARLEDIRLIDGGYEDE